MTKRKARGEEATVIGQVTLPPPVETPVALPPEVGIERAKFIVGVWRDLPVWRCTACPFDTFDGEAAVLEHWQIEHVPHPNPERT